MPVSTAERHDVTVQAEPSRRGSTDLVPRGLVRRPSRQQLLLVVLLLAVVAFAVTRVVGGSGTDAAAPIDEPVAATPQGVAPAVNEEDIAFEATVEELKEFVAERRELEFQRPVEAVRLDDEAFAATFTEQHPMDDISVAVMRDAERVMKAFGLISPGYDLVEEVLDPASQTQGVLGWYDPDSERLYVRGGEITPLVKATLVHELVHALDDQHFDLAAMMSRQGELEENLAARALIEGNAERLEQEYVETLSSDEQEARRAEGEENAAEDDLSGAEADFEPAHYFEAFPYLDGPMFVQALEEQGGEAAVDAAFQAPPTTTAEIIEHARYRAGLSGHRLAPPAVDGTIVQSGMFGELGLFLMLAEAVGPTQAGIAAAPWEADSYVAYEEGDRMCVRLHVLLEDPWTTQLTAQILTGWATQQIDASVNDLGIVQATSCR